MSRLIRLVGLAVLFVAAPIFVFSQQNLTTNVSQKDEQAAAREYFIREYVIGPRDLLEIKVFELPEDAARRYKLVSPYKDQKLTVKELCAGKEAVFALKPFEVLVIEALPEK